MAQWEKTLQDAVDLQPEHLSCYGLKLEPGTPLFARQGELTFPDDDAQADMYLYTVAFLKEHGYEQYEISNFAKPGFASKHNLKYWLLQEYAGFGPGAHSDFGDVRYGYLRDIDRYIAGELVLSERETISRRERDMEYIMLRLRLARGADPREFENAFRERFNPLAKLLHQYAAHGLACQNDDGSWASDAEGLSCLEPDHRRAAGGAEPRKGRPPGPRRPRRLQSHRLTKYKSYNRQHKQTGRI